MKTNRFWYFMAAAAVFAGMTTLVSCDKEEPFEQEIIESEVLEEGVAEEVTEETGTEGTTLSYESWIVVKGQTRAAFENKVSVTLFNRFNHVIDEVEVDGFEFGEPTVDISFREAESRVEQNYVTIADSVLVYRLTYENGFVLEYELMYEVPTYDDGITRKQMPYIRYGAIVDNGMTVTGMDNLEENGQTWFRKLVRHSISVVFNDKSYTVEASVVVKSPEEPQDVLLASKKVNEGVELVSSDPQTAAGTYKAWVEIEQTWSESGVKTVRKEALLKHYVEFPNDRGKLDADEMYEDLSLSPKISTDEQTVTKGEAVDGVAVDVYSEKRRIRIKKDGAEEINFTILIPCTAERARYVDEMLTCDFPVPAEYSYAEEYQLVSGWTEQVNDAGQPCYVAEYRFDCTVTYGSNVYTSDCPVILEYCPE